MLLLSSLSCTHKGGWGTPFLAGTQDCGWVFNSTRSTAGGVVQRGQGIQELGVQLWLNSGLGSMEIISEEAAEVYRL